MFLKDFSVVSGKLLLLQFEGDVVVVVGTVVCLCCYCCCLFAGFVFDNIKS